MGQQAVAFLIAGDEAEFYRVAFLGGQDTLYDKAGRHYYKNCYIQGSIDFVFGAGDAYFDVCHTLHPHFALDYISPAPDYKRTESGTVFRA